MRIAIVGGTGTLGRKVVAELAGRGHDVRVLSRGGAYRVDLTTGEGLSAALQGCAVVVDASNATSTKRARQVLVGGTQKLLTAEREAAVSHHVCVSIVGCDAVPMGYYKVKVDQEHLVEDGQVPWTIVQATQFHELAATTLAAAARFLVLPVPALTLQTIAAAEVARALADIAEGPALGRRVHVAGPEVNTARDLALTWRHATGRKAVLVPIPIPGKFGRTLRDGGLTDREPDIRGAVTFPEWLAGQ